MDTKRYDRKVHSDIQNKCFWENPSYKPNSELEGDHETDVLIVGGGVAGLFTAYALKKYGAKKVTILESSYIGSGSTGYSAGIFTSETETALWDSIIKTIGKQKSSLYFDEMKKALKTVSSVIRQGKIECDFAPRDYYYVSSDKVGAQLVEQELAAMHGFGDTKSRRLTNAQLGSEFKTSLYSVGMKREIGVSVNPMKFAQGMGKYLQEKKGVTIFENTVFKKAVDNCAYTRKGKIRFKHIVYTRGIYERAPGLQNYITTIGVTKPLSQKSLAALKLLDKDMFSDTHAPSFFYGKVTADDRLLLGYGDTKTSTKTAHGSLHMPHVNMLKRYCQRFADSSLKIHLEYAWSGIFSLSNEVLPYVSHTKDCTVIGGAGSQMASVALADYAAARILHKKHGLSDVFKV